MSGSNASNALIVTPGEIATSLLQASKGQRGELISLLEVLSWDRGRITTIQTNDINASSEVRNRQGWWKLIGRYRSNQVNVLTNGID